MVVTARRHVRGTAGFWQSRGPRLGGPEVAVEHDQKYLHVEAVMAGLARELVHALVAVPARRQHRLFVHPVHLVCGLVVAKGAPSAVSARSMLNNGIHFGRLSE